MADSAASYHSKEGDTVDEIVWRHYENSVTGALEQVLEANRGLADLGPVLPVGTVVLLPVFEETKESESVSLWD
ncbi:tail protein X [Pseudophaeobacter flagellatus]|uniref:tail protein X n=1 Tax=Pseudophaeobacter flagellatus TaxID=2899119 RepID=UPI001E50378A|nr:tail protein X [Pseudophaeobacter flagellatus]MCD9147829.1 tail protein X [Pseudophaeobacter flagellatus]